MKSAMTGVVMGAAAGLVVYFAYLLAQFNATEFVPDAPALLLGLQLASGIGAALGGWVGVLIALLRPEDRHVESQIRESEPFLAEAESREDRLAV